MEWKQTGSAGITYHLYVESEIVELTETDKCGYQGGVYEEMLAKRYKFSVIR
jgi:hypothetical protein